MTKSIFATLLIALSMVELSIPASAAETTVKDKYHAIQVDRFDIQVGVEFPPDYLLTLQEEILKELQNAQKFMDVLRAGENPTDATTPVLRLTGTVTHFKAGSRAKRYFVGFGAGSTEIFVHVVFVDRASSETVFTEEVRGTMAGGFMGGESMNVTRDFARTIVTSTKLVMEKRLPAPGDPTLATEANSPRPESIGRHVVSISSGDFDGARQKLNAEGASGYRVSGFTVTGGKTAEVAMEKVATLPQTYQYLLLHVLRASSLEKDLNNSTGDQFRMCPHTLALLKGMMVLIMEKAPASPDSNYQYRVHETMRVSSAEKDIQNDQSQGYVLAETSELGGIHLVVLEKVIKRKAASN